MVERGDVLQLKRRLGFAAKGVAESVVVVQPGSLSAVFPTVLIVPLDAAVDAFPKFPLVLRVSRQEAGARVDHVAVPWRLSAISADALAPGPVGRLRPDTIAALDELLKIVLGLT